jgi:hypothetical protein
MATMPPDIYQPSWTLSQIYEGIELPPGIAEPELPEYAVAFDRALMEPESPPN